MSAPLEVHYWPTPNGHKVTIACEEMELPYVIKPVNIGRGHQFEAEFLAISPNNRMPALVDPDGPDGKPISVFESGAILQYLGRKSGRFYPAEERARVKVDEWVFWQMGGLGPMAGQANHFRNYSPSFLPDQRHSAYGANRYTNEVHRLYGVLNTQLAGREFIAGDYSIADMITWPWVANRSNAAVQLEDFPHLAAWQKRIAEREPVKRALAQADAIRGRTDLAQSSAEAEAQRKLLFGQRAR